MSKKTVAVIQAASAAFDAKASIEKLAHFASEAASQGAELAVFPEAFISGYPKGLDFGARIGFRRPEGREDFRLYSDGAIEVPGAECALMGEIAARENIELVVGVIEKGGATLYCTILFFSNKGELRGKHRKLMPTASERLIWGFGDGSTLPVFDTPLGRLGAVICWENYMPLLRTAMYSKGIELYCAPTADDRDTWLSSMRHIALEGRCFVLSACQFARRSDYPDDYALDEAKAPEDVIMRGGSCIISPLGDVLAGPDFDGEKILIAEIDQGDLARSKMDMDAVGHYARPDIFELTVNERVQRGVNFIGSGDDMGAGGAGSADGYGGGGTGALREDDAGSSDRRSE